MDALRVQIGKTLNVHKVEKTKQFANQNDQTKNELEKADPQQRLLLLVVRECLERAGVTDYRGTLTGLFVGTFSEDWLQTQSKEEQHPSGYVLTGHLDPMLANRVAFEYDLRGPW